MIKPVWSELTDDEKLEIINPVLDNLRNSLLSKDTIDCVISTYSDNEKPEIKNGAWKIEHIPYISNDTIEIKVNRIKNT